MPHKKNPILSENVSGLAKVIRSLVIPALENITTWHERDISHSSVERINAPNATITLDFAVQRMINIINNLVVHEKNMLKNVDLPNNYDIIYSDSGKQKHLIDQSKDRHTKIFDSHNELISNGYIDASKIDLYATKWFNKNNINVGLIAH